MLFNNTFKPLLLIGLTLQLLSSSVQAKDANILSYVDRGIKYYPKYVSPGVVKIGKASWYGKPFHGRLTASGERYNMYKMTAAHRTYAINTILKVTNLENKKSVKVRVNDRGPFYHSRDIDLSYGAAKKIGLTKKGVGKVKIEVISGSKKRSKKKRVIRKKRIKKQPKRLVKSKKSSSKTIQTKQVRKKRPKVYTLAQKSSAQNRRTHLVQIASFKEMQRAQKFKAKQGLKNSMIIKKYLPKEKRTTYRVVVRCNAWEAKRLLQSKKFKGAFLLS